MQEFKRLLHHRHDGSKTKTDKVWLCESVGKLNVLGQQERAKMNQLIIHIISYLQLHVHHHGIPKVHIQGFSLIYDIALQNLLGKPLSSFKDHRKAKNPYLSRYEEIWVDKLESSTAISKFCCIMNLILFMMNESEKLMKGSVRKDNFFFVHDSLVLITAKELIN